MDQKPRRGNPAWRPGQSGNPRGRPPKGNALTEAIQAGCDPAELRDIALDIARTDPIATTRLAALHWLSAAGFTRPAERHELAMGAVEPDEDLSHLSLDQVREVARLEQLRADIISGTGVTEPLAIEASSTEIDHRPSD